MCLKRAITYQQIIAGSDYKNNQLHGVNKFDIALILAVTDVILGPDS